MEVKGIGQGGQISVNPNGTSSNVEALNNTSEYNVNTDLSNKEMQSDNGKNVSEKDVKKAVDKLNKLMEDTPTHLQYEVYGKFKDIIVSIVDTSTNKVVKEIPPKKIVDMVDKLCELAGVFLDKKV